MKKIYLCLLILTFFGSCAEDENISQEISSSILKKGVGDTLPAFSANPFDAVGLIYDELFDAYYDGTIRDTTVSSVISTVEAIANSNISFANLDSSYTSLSAERVQYLAALRPSDIGDIIGASTMSSSGKTSFINFLISYAALYSSETDALTIYNALLKYEESVLNNSLLGLDDKRIILITTSIVRYSSYRAKKKPKKNTDPDWLISVGHVFGTESGAEENEAKAIVEGLVTGIVSNK